LNNAVLTSEKKHFNTLYGLLPVLYMDAGKFVHYCSSVLNIEAQTDDFKREFSRVTQRVSAEDGESV